MEIARIIAMYRWFCGGQSNDMIGKYLRKLISWMDGNIYSRKKEIRRWCNDRQSIQAPNIPNRRTRKELRRLLDGANAHE
ncbi:hypothetical protein EUGRSUZ_K01681 [Eucalyptus grandis]|uniref:Uncharacterized protein n=2 Tax=Eucalyptus grandis TaxID=71139 RepID=A0ACC3IUA8_EUCGR|nr:hypothetical protein EUGRSUZ_K01681 [Eucalyptus grandis]